MAKKIRINSVNPSGPTSDGPDLMNYYFEESGDGYNFYAPTNPPTQVNPNLIDPAVQSSCTFHFPVPPGLPGAGTTFYITVNQFPAVLTMAGTWSDLPQQSLKDVPGSGTFQAQAGTTPVEEEASAASA